MAPLCMCAMHETLFPFLAGAYFFGLVVACVDVHGLRMYVSVYVAYPRQNVFVVLVVCEHVDVYRNMRPFMLHMPRKSTFGRTFFAQVLSGHSLNMWAKFLLHLNLLRLSKFPVSIQTWLRACGNMPRWTDLESMPNRGPGVDTNAGPIPAPACKRHTPHKGEAGFSHGDKYVCMPHYPARLTT
jgi:hypothetical protein